MRGQGRIFLRGAAHWIAYSVRGKERRESATQAVRAAEAKARRKFSDEERRAEAQKLLDKRLREAANDAEGIKAFVGPHQYRITVGQLLDDLETDVKLRQVGGLDGILSHLKRIRQAFGDRRATDIGTATVDKYIKARLSEPDPPAKATVNRETQLLAQAFRLGVEHQRISAAPKVRKLSEKGNVRQGFFEQGDFERVVEGLPRPLKGYAQFAYYSGWRRGEIQSLLWADVDMLAQTIRLRPLNSKEREGRVLKLPVGLWNIIMNQWALREFEKGRKGHKTRGISDLVFHRQGQPNGDIRVSWREACAAAKVEAKLFHDFRRTAVRNMIRAGVPERIAMAISGHKTNSMLYRYAIVREDDTKEALERTQAYLNSAPRSGEVKGTAECESKHEDGQVTAS
jgi:integrase